MDKEDIVERLSTLENKVENNRKIQEKNQEKINELEEDMAKLSQAVNRIDSELSSNSSRMDFINEFAEEIKSELERFKSETEDKRGDLERTVHEVKAALQEDETKTVPKNKNNLKSLCISMSRQEREEKLSKDLYRSTVLWEKFDEWAHYVQKGKLLKSGKVKTLLSAELSMDLEYSQVYRVMKTFDDNTPEHYEYTKNKAGKCLIKNT